MPDRLAICPASAMPLPRTCHATATIEVDCKLIIFYYPTAGDGQVRNELVQNLQGYAATFLGPVKTGASQPAEPPTSALWREVCGVCA
jgi:hypothetical protein